MGGGDERSGVPKFELRSSNFELDRLLLHDWFSQCRNDRRPLRRLAARNVARHDRRGRRHVLGERQALDEPQHLIGVEDLAREQLVRDLQQDGLVVDQNLLARS
jgi:hypothetical protein